MTAPVQQKQPAPLVQKPQPQQQILPELKPQQPIPKSQPRLPIPKQQVQPRQAFPVNPGPIDPERRIPFSTDAQIAESQQGSGDGFSQTPAERSRRADIREGWYIGAGGGMSLANNADNRKSSDAFITDVDPKIIGFAVSGVAGLKMLKNIRAEAEVFYASNQLNELNVITPGSTGLTVGRNAVDGDITALAIMANGYYDFPIADD
ncbi:MAG: hypothetical protein ACO3MW_15085, partial [Rhodospirillales bacterium]